MVTIMAHLDLIGAFGSDSESGKKQLRQDFAGIVFKFGRLHGKVNTTCFSWNESYDNTDICKFRTVVKKVKIFRRRKHIRKISNTVYLMRLFYRPKFDPHVLRKILSSKISAINSDAKDGYRHLKLVFGSRTVSRV